MNSNHVDYGAIPLDLVMLVDSVRQAINAPGRDLSTMSYALEIPVGSLYAFKVGRVNCPSPEALTKMVNYLMPGTMLAIPKTAGMDANFPWQTRV